MQAEYVLGGTDLISQTRGAQNDYYLTDALGSVRLLTDSAGAVTNTYRYNAFGNLVAQTGNRENSYLYTGQQFDAATGLYSLRAREYDPGAGRFLSYDTWPIDIQNPLELNRYGYGMNNPVNFADPSGMSALVELGQLLVEVGGGILVIFYQQFLPLFIGQTLSTLISGGAQGIVGYMLGLGAYNVLHGKSPAEDFEPDDAIEAMFLGCALGFVNSWIKHPQNILLEEVEKQWTLAFGRVYLVIGAALPIVTTYMFFDHMLSELGLGEPWDHSLVDLLFLLGENAAVLAADVYFDWPDDTEIVFSVILATINNKVG